jgi:predicted DNA-binding protein (MmcQ/YjbR family)
MSPDSALQLQLAELRAFALTYPEATPDHPWDHWVAKVRGKVFAFLDEHEGSLHVTVKLPLSAAEALLLPFCEPTGYGLGKSGWVSARFPKETSAPSEMVEAWIDESWRAVAPKRLVKAFPPRA